MTRMLTTADQAFADLGKELAAKIDTKFSEMDRASQEKFVAAAREISQMRDDLVAARTTLNDRFRTLLAMERGGEYRGTFGSAAVAEAFGRECVATLRPDLRSSLGVDDAMQRAGIERAAVSPSSGAEGGYLIPTQFVDGIIRNVERYGVLEREAARPPFTSLTASRVKRTQGAQCYYPDLGASPTESALRFARVNYQPTRYSSYVAVDNWMLESQAYVAIGELVADELGLAIAYSSDLNGFMGDGSPSYARVTGLFRRSGAASVAALATGQVLKVVAATGDTTFQAMIEGSSTYLTQALGLVPDYADMDGRLKWFGSRSVFFGYLGVRDSNDRPIGDLFRTNAGLERTLCGYPYEFVQVAPKIADTAVSTTMLVLANLPMALDLARFRNAVRLRIGNEVRFLQGETVFAMDALQDIVLTDGSPVVQLVTAAA